MKIRPLAFLKWFCFLLWSVLTLGYFFYRFPVRNLVEVLFSGATLFILVSWFIVVGHRVLQAFRVEYASFSEEISLSFGVGTGVTIFAVFLLATFHLLYEPLIVVLVLLVGGLLYLDAKTFFLRGHSLAASFLRQPHSIGDITLMALIGLSTLLTFIGAATPTFFFDALYYHLAVPHKYLLHHGFHYIPHQEFSNVPFNSGMLFLVAMSFSKTLLPQLFSWVFTPMTALTIYSVAKPIGGKRMALLAAAIFWSIPAVLTISTLTSVEGGLMLYTILALSTFWRYVNSSSRIWFVLSAGCCSLAAGTKYTAFVTTLTGMFSLVLGHESLVKKRGFRQAATVFIIYAGIVVIGISPWLIKNIVYTGNPLFPFLQSLFNRQAAAQGVKIDQAMAHDGNPLYQELFLSRHDPAKNIDPLKVGKIILTAPWEFTMTITGAAGKPGILFLLGLPGIFFIQPVKRPMKYLLGFALVSFVCWMVGISWLQRYAAPMFPAFSLIIAYILCDLPCVRPVKHTMFCLALIVLHYHLLLFLLEERQVLRQFDYLLSNQSQEEFLLGHDVPYYPAAQFINTQTPPDAKILFVAEARGYYCERDYILYTPLYSVLMDEIPLRRVIQESVDIHDLRRRLRQLGVTHILLNMREMQRVSTTYFGGKHYFWFANPKDAELYKTLFSPQHANVIYSQYQIVVYELTAQPES